MAKIEKIFIVDDIGLIRANLDKVKTELARARASVIALSDSVFLFLKAKGIDCVSYRDFEKPDMYEKIYATSYEWGRNWYKPKGVDLTFRGVFSMGEMLEWSMIYFFAHFLRLYVSLREIIKQTDPVEVLCFIPSRETDIGDYEELQKTGGNLLSHLIREYTSDEARGAVLRAVTLQNVPGAKKRDRSFPRKVFSLANILISKVIGLRAKGKKILFFEGAKHFREIMKDGRIKKFGVIHLEKTIGPSLLPGFYSEGVKVVTLDAVKGIPANTALWEMEQVKRELAGFFRYGDKDVMSYMWPRIEFLFDKFLPDVVAPDIDKVKKVIEGIKPNCVVAENNSTYYEKMLLIIARSKSIPTAVIQDGNTLYDDASKKSGLVFHNFVPLIADVFLAFGEASKDWFKSMGVDEDRIVSTGASRFDEHYSKNRSVKTGSSGKNKIAVIMDDTWNKDGVVTHHIGLNVFAGHLKHFIDFAKKNPGIEMIIRPHDRHHIWDEVMREELTGAGNIYISRQETLKDLFQGVDLVIGYTSTALIEALIHRVPVISIDTGEFFNYVPLWKYGLSKRVPDLSELEAAVRSLLYDDTERESARREIDRGTEYFNHGDDGLATRRIAGELDRIMAGTT